MDNQPESHRFTIYHLAKRDGTAFFLHPFTRRGAFAELPANAELAGFYGLEPRVESLTLLRNELYRRIDEDVRDWINERRFIPRFLISSGVFLLVFLFLALAVHTPIPLVDEILGSGAAAIFTYIMIGRYFENSRSAMQRRIALRAQVDNVVFTESGYVKELEEVLQRLERAEPDLSSVAGGEDVQHLWKANMDSTRHVHGLLRRLLRSKLWKRADRDIRRGRLSSTVSSSFEEKKTDPAVILLYHELSRTAP